MAAKSQEILQAMTEEQLLLARHTSYYWLDTKTERLYKRVIWNGNSQLVIIVDEWLQLLKACYDEVEY